MFVNIFVFMGLNLLFINYFRYGMFRSLYLTLGIVFLVNAVLTGNALEALAAIIIFPSAYVIYNHAYQNDVRFKFIFATITFFFLPLGLLIYFLLWKKFSTKIGKTVKTDAGTITFHNNHR